VLNIAVLVSGGGTNLQALLDAQASGALGSGRIALVVSNKPAAYALTRATQAGVPCAVLEKHAGETPHAYGERLLALLGQNRIHLVVLAGFLLILAENVVRAYAERIVNVHPSLIPSFCGEGFYGLRVHQAALARGVKVTGATVHLVNEVPDGGRILLQQAVPVLAGDTPESLQRRVMEQAEWRILPEAVRLLVEGLTQQGYGEA
jgi:phosphoribosylglycinamide formyltransferase-1